MLNTLHDDVLANLLSFIDDPYDMYRLYCVSKRMQMFFKTGLFEIKFRLKEKVQFGFLTQLPALRKVFLFRTYYSPIDLSPFHNMTNITMLYMNNIRLITNIGELQKRVTFLYSFHKLSPLPKKKKDINHGEEPLDLIDIKEYFKQRYEMKHRYKHFSKSI
jgi:hypothetical protein